MSKDHTERRTYHKSPGRQYGYNYNPLHSGTNPGERESRRGATASKSDALLERPNPRRTRQLMRQSIIASKRGHEDTTEIVDAQDDYGDKRQSQRLPLYNNIADEPLLSQSGRYTLHNETSGQQPASHPSRRLSREKLSGGRTSTRGTRRFPREEYLEDYTPTLPSKLQQAQAGWRDYPVDDPDLDAEDLYDPLNQQVSYDDDYDDDYLQPQVEESPRQFYTPSMPREPRLTRRLEPDPELEYPEEDENYDYGYEEANPSVRPTRKKKKLSRRGLLIGAGAAAAVGVGVAAYEMTPRIPGTVGQVTSDIEHQIQDAFNRGVNQGMDQARKEILGGLDNLEGFTLDAAINAARLTRIAYDVFVSPVVKFGSAITSDFLSGMLKSFKTARDWLKGVYQDNATLAAIESVLTSWVNQANVMPKQLDSITQADLDGAQAYLRALKRKLEDERSKLNKPQNQQGTSTPAPKP